MKTQLKNYLEQAMQEKFAIPAFNLLNMETAQVFVDVAEQEKAPVILQISESSINYAGFEYIEAILKIADQSPNVFVHLDHGIKLEMAKKCLDSDAFSSVMIDASKQSLENNINISKQVKDYSGQKLVEAELGIVGGKEEDIIAEDSIYTKIDEAISFVEHTKVDIFAPAVGTMHGVYKSEPKLNYDLVRDLKKVISIPLVLHGTSGLSDAQVQDFISAGMSKINMDTELKQNFLVGLKAYLQENPEAYDLRKVFGAAKESMHKIAAHKVKICGASGKI